MAGKDTTPFGKRGRKTHDLRRMSVRLLFLMLLAHIVLMAVFAAVGIKAMVAVNAAGILCFAVLIALLTSSRLPLSVANKAAMGEVIFHTVCSIILVGWSSGFSKYCIALVSVVFFWSRVSEKYDKRFHHPLFISCCIAALYFVLGAICEVRGAIYSVPLFWARLLYIANSVISFTAIIAFAKVYSDEIENIERGYRHDSNIDELTRLYNRRKVREILGDVHEAAVAGGMPYMVAMIDIDNFKIVNDTYGHNVGDYALVTVSHLLMKRAGETEKACRWGGDELLLIGVPDKAAQMLEALEGFRKDVEETDFKQNGVSFNLSVTIGVASYKEGLKISEVIAKADAALYQGKDSGKNCIRIAPQ